MRSRVSGTIVCLLTILLLVSATALAGRRDHSQVRAAKGVKESDRKPTEKKPEEKPFADLIKDKIAIEGLFTFYHDTVDNTMLMVIKPEQLGPIYLCGESRTQSEGRFYDNGSMRRTFPFHLKRVGKNILFLEKNVRIRADSASTMGNSVKSGISDHLVASTKIKSQPDDSGAILIDPASMFIRDAANTGHFLGQQAKTGISFDSKNSYFKLVKSFPENTEIDVTLHFRTSKPQSGTTLQSGCSFFHTYHYSLSTLPQTDYVPRLADDRIGYFLTMYQDYSSLDEETAYVRYIRRWHLKKKNPGARISEPVEPIVFWVENTVPEEYRDAIAEGIEFWNPCFEKIGFRNAVIAKQMPDDADWDPADVRYNTIQWMVQPGAAYAVGPSRANPFTGQVYDADIRMSTDFIRHMFNTAEMWISPVSFDGGLPEGIDLFEPEQPFEASSDNPDICNYALESAREAAFGLTYVLASVGDLADKDSLTREYVHAYLAQTTAHEVGHTLGFRHNFRASTIYTLEQLADREFTKENSTTGSIMDYSPANIRMPGKPQGEFYASEPGPWDYWMVEYGYSDFGAETAEEELPRLQEIASRSADPLLTYGTDEDAFGYTAKSIDPLTNLFDQGSDPLRYAQHQLSLTKELWQRGIKEFETDGQRYQKIYAVFRHGWRSYSAMAQLAPKYVGGLYHHRHHIGDPGGKLPFEPVPAAMQREAVAFLRDNLFAPDAFDLPADLLNKLQQENLQDFSWSAMRVPQVDFPLHQTALLYQNRALGNLYSTYILGRLLNNLERYKEGEEKYTMYDMFTDVRRAIWSEIVGPSNVNSFRRQLQLSHLNRISNIYLSKPSLYPSDARTLAANDLNILETAAKKAIKSPAIDDMTKAHFQEVVRQIEATKKAQREYAEK